MKKYFFHFCISIFSIVFLFGCSEKLPISADFEETAIVYGLLDQSENIHFLKINRAFIGPGNSLDIAKISDSSYFKNIDVIITEIGNLNRKWTLQDSIISNKSVNGVFYGPEQKLYYFNDNNVPLSADATYKLEITVDKGMPSEFKVSGETSLVSGIGLTGNPPMFKFYSSDNKFLGSNLIVYPGNAEIINTTFKISIAEFTNSIEDSIQLNWKIDEKSVSNSSSLNFSYQGQTFYEIIKSGITNNNSITKRNLKSIKIILTGGSNDLYNYMLINKPSSSVSQSKPSFTNLKTNKSNKKALGLFSARYTRTYYLPFTKSYDSYFRLLDQYSTAQLCNGSITTYDYHFCSIHPADATKSYFCQ